MPLGIEDAFGAATGILGKGIDFGASVGAAQLNYEMTRKLRQKQYQDMMFSMREAGLNPVLAAGASPGSSATQPIGSGPTDLTSGAESARRSAKLSSEKALIQAQEKTALAGARKAEAEALTAEAVRDATVRGKTAEADFAEGSLKSRIAQTRAAYEVTANTSRLTNRELELDLPKILADQRLAEAGLTTAREQGQRARNVPDVIEASRLANEWARSLKQAGGYAGDIADLAGPLFRALVGGRTGRVRSTGTSARSPGSGTKVPGSGRDSVRADHPRRYSSDEEGNFIDKHTGEILKTREERSYR